MTYTPQPPGTLLDLCEYFGVRQGRKVYRNEDRLFTWDSRHSEIEVFNRNGWHLGAIDPHTGTWLKDATEGHRIYV
jgi:hypothetical protein